MCDKRCSGKLESWIVKIELYSSLGRVPDDFDQLRELTVTCSLTLAHVSNYLFNNDVDR